MVLLLSLGAAATRLAKGGGESSVGNAPGPVSPAIVSFTTDPRVKTAIASLEARGYSPFESETRVAVVGGRCFSQRAMEVCDRDSFVSRSYFKADRPIVVVSGVVSTNVRAHVGTKFTFVPDAKLKSLLTTLLAPSAK